jgi:hypothetical protein
MQLTPLPPACPPADASESGSEEEGSGEEQSGGERLHTAGGGGSGGGAWQRMAGRQLWLECFYYCASFLPLGSPCPQRRAATAAMTMPPTRLLQPPPRRRRGGPQAAAPVRLLPLLLLPAKTTPAAATTPRMMMLQRMSAGQMMGLRRPCECMMSWRQRLPAAWRTCRRMILAMPAPRRLMRSACWSCTHSSGGRAHAAGAAAAAAAVGTAVVGQ